MPELSPSWFTIYLKSVTREQITLVLVVSLYPPSWRGRKAFNIMGQLFRSEFGRDVGVDATKDLFDAIFTWRTNGNPKISKLIKSSNNLLNTIMDHGNPTTCLLALINCLRERNRGYEFQNFVLSYLDKLRTVIFLT